MLLLIYIPIVASVVFATINTYKRGSNVETSILGLCGLVIVVNGVMRHFAFEGWTPNHFVLFFEQLMNAMIIPLAYMYFSLQVNRPLFNPTTNVLLGLVSLVFLPNIVIGCTDDAGFEECIIGGYEFAIGDIVIILQALVSAMRIVPLLMLLKKYGLKPSKDVRMFLWWWCVTTLFVIVASVTSGEGMSNDAINICCHIVFMLIVSSIFVLIGRGFDIVPVLRHAEDDPQMSEMAAKLNDLIEREKVHLIRGYIVDMAVVELGMNRTYFCNMVKREFGCTFSELLNKKRVECVKDYLLNTNYSLNVISDMCGFCTESYMIKIFKHLEGVTPKVWRDSKIVK